MQEQHQILAQYVFAVLSFASRTQKYQSHQFVEFTFRKQVFQQICFQVLDLYEKFFYRARSQELAVSL